MRKVAVVLLAISLAGFAGLAAGASEGIGQAVEEDDCGSGRKAGGAQGPVRVVPGAQCMGTLRYRQGQYDTDHYVLRLGPGDLVFLNATTISGIHSLDACVSNECGTRTPGAVTVRLQARSTGDYPLIVGGVVKAADGHGTYSMTVDVVPAALHHEVQEGNLKFGLPLPLGPAANGQKVWPGVPDTQGHSYAWMRLDPSATPGGSFRLEWDTPLPDLVLFDLAFYHVNATGFHFEQSQIGCVEEAPRAIACEVRETQKVPIHWVAIILERGAHVDYRATYTYFELW